MFEDLIAAVVAIPPGSRDELDDLAKELADMAILPVLGAGGSVTCGTPRATALAKQLFEKVSDGTVALKRPPADLSHLTDDLGKMADAICLEHSPSVVLEQLGFRDEDRWPSAERVRDAYDKSPHACPYRVMARMARERLITEAVSFNYDCHFEGGLLKEGFFGRRRRTHHDRWPELFTVIADAPSHASVARRGEFVLNKVHGCVDTWRREDAKDPHGASASIIIRWSQLLDWRTDQWSRDLMRDRARRNILVLIGFSGLDPVIHSTLQAVMREVDGILQTPGPSRIRAIDTDPNKLTLGMLVNAGRRNNTDVPTIQVSNGLAATLFAVHAALLGDRLAEFALANGMAPHLPPDPGDRLRRLAISGPAMLRWTWATLVHAYGLTGLNGLREAGDDYYVPLLAEPMRTLRAFDVRDELAVLTSRAAEGAAYTAAGSFLTDPRNGRALMPLGLHEHEVGGLEARLHNLTDLGSDLTSPAGSLDRILVGRDASGLRGFSLETGEEVDVSL